MTNRIKRLLCIETCQLYIWNCVISEAFHWKQPQNLIYADAAVPSGRQGTTSDEQNHDWDIPSLEFMKP